MAGRLFHRVRPAKLGADESAALQFLKGLAKGRVVLLGSRLESHILVTNYSILVYKKDRAPIQAVLGVKAAILFRYGVIVVLK